MARAGAAERIPGCIELYRRCWFCATLPISPPCFAPMVARRGIQSWRYGEMQAKRASRD